MNPYPENEDLIDLRVAAAQECCVKYCLIGGQNIIDGVNRQNTLQWYSRDGGNYKDQQTTWQHSQGGCSAPTPYWKKFYQLNDAPAYTDLGCTATKDGDIDIFGVWRLYGSSGKTPETTDWPNSDTIIGLGDSYFQTFYKKEAWGVSSFTRAARFPTSIKVRFTIGGGIYVYALAVNYQLEIIKFCPGQCATVEIQNHVSEWVLVDNTDIYGPSRTVDVTIPIPVIPSPQCPAIPPWDPQPPNPTCPPPNPGFLHPSIAETRVNMTLGFDTFQYPLCQGYQYSPNLACLVVCFDENYESVSCDNPARVYCYNTNSELVDCELPPC